MKTTIIILTAIACLLPALPSYSNNSQGRDRERGRGAGRGSCDLAVAQSTPQEELMPLVPEKGDTQVTSVTPSFWFYSPYIPTTSLAARFTLRDENGQLVGTPTIVNLPKAPGIFSVQVTQPLKQGATYRWYFSVECNADRPARNPLVKGAVKVIDPGNKLSSSLKKSSSPVQTAEIYRQAGFWNDALTILANQQQKDADARTAWIELLKAEKLDEFTSKPVLNCCTGQ